MRLQPHTIPIVSPSVQLEQRAYSTFIRIAVWGTVLLISNLPVILCNELLHIHVPWLFGAQTTLLLMGLLLSLGVPALRPLRLFFAIFAVLNVAEWGTNTLSALLEVDRWLSRSGIPFVDSLAVGQANRFVIALIMLAASWLLFHQRHAFFFGMGKLRATAAPISFVGMSRPSTWNRLGPIMAFCLAMGLIVFALIAGGAPFANLSHAAPLLPFVLFFAALNAFGEEISYRAPQLGALSSVVGESQALLVTAVYFGIGHFYGVPYGIVGVLMASVLGWLLGRSLLETKGMFWAWFIHVVMDVVIFTFMAAGSLTPGGR